MYTIKKLTTDIYYFENIIKNSQSILDSISEWRIIENRDKSFYWETKTFTDAQIDLHLRDACTLAKNIWMFDHDLELDFYKKSPGTVIWKRHVGMGMSPHKDSVWNEMVYDEKQETTDVSLTVLSYFSTDFDGGEIFFPDADVSIKPSAGSILVFKGQEMHGLLPVTRGTRTVGSQFYFENEAYEKFKLKWEQE